MYQDELDMKVSDFTFVTDGQSHVLKLVELWTILNEWESDSHVWVHLPVMELSANDIKLKVSNTKKRLQKLSDAFSDKPQLMKLAISCQSAISHFENNCLELICILRHESFRERHWKELLTEIYRTELPRLDKLTFRQLMDKNIRSHRSFLNLLSEKAQNQYIVEFRIDDIERSMCNTPVVIRHNETDGNMTIMNEQTVKAAFTEHREKCEEMLRVSEHLEAFLQQIYKVLNRIDRLEEVFGHLLELQELISHLKAIRLVPNLAKELTKKDNILIDTVLSKYFSVYDDMKTMGLSQVMKHMVLMDEKTDDPEEPLHKQNMSSPTAKLHTTEEYVDALRKIYHRISMYFTSSIQALPRLLFVTIEKFCDIVHLSIGAKRLCGMETFFPEVVEFTVTTTIPYKITGCRTARGESLSFTSALSIDLSHSSECLDQIKTKVLELEKEIITSVKSGFQRGLNFFITNSYNFEKYYQFLQETKTLFQCAEGVLRLVAFQDLSLLLDNPIVSTPKESIRIRITKYLANVVGPLRKFNLVTYKDAVVEGNVTKFWFLESYISVLLYLAELLSELIKLGEYDYTGFYWQSRLKHSLIVQKDKVSSDLSRPSNLETFLKTISFALKESEGLPNLFALSLGSMQLSLDSFDVSIQAFDRPVKYGYQLDNNSNRCFFTSRTEKATVNLLVAVSQARLIGLKGQDCSGKSSTVYYLSRMCGRYCKTLNLSICTSPSYVAGSLMSAVGTAGWVILNNMQEASGEVLTEICKIVQALKKYYDYSMKRQILIERVEYSLTYEYNLFLIQSSKFFTSRNFVEVPSLLLAEFRSNCIVTCDMFTFIYSQLADLIYFEDFDPRYVEGLSRSLLLFFQLMSNGLSDKVFLTSQVSYETAAVPEYLVQEATTWRMTLSSVRPLLQKIKMAIKLEQNKSTVFKTIFRAIYAALRYQLSVQQREALMLNFLAVFEPGSEMFSINDKTFKHQAPLIQGFFTANKIPAYTNVCLVENIHCMADTCYEDRPKVYINFGSNLQIYTDSFSKLLVYMLAKKTNVSVSQGINC